MNDSVDGSPVSGLGTTSGSKRLSYFALAFVTSLQKRHLLRLHFGTAVAISNERILPPAGGSHEY
jgi:hypothetical protein